MVTESPRRVTYRGNPAFAAMLVQLLEEEGVAVEWERPAEQRGIPEMAQGVVVALAVRGTLAAIQTAVHRFRKRMHGSAAAIVEDDEPDDDEDGAAAV